MDKQEFVDRLDKVLKHYNVPLRHTLTRILKLRFDELSNKEFEDGIALLQDYYNKMKENPNFMSQINFNEILNSNPDLDDLMHESGFSISDFMGALHNPELQLIVEKMLAEILGEENDH